jgi:Holliday junction DNA helicase RuvB
MISTMQDRLISSVEKTEDHIDRAIRPATLADYVGQPVVCEQMEIFIGAARGRGEALDHTLIFGPQVWEKPHLPILLPVKWG